MYSTYPRFSLALIALIVLAMMSSCAPTIYAPATFVSFTGRTYYCTEQIPDTNRAYYSECHNSGSTSRTGMNFKVQWFYNHTGDTIISTSTPLDTPVMRTAPVNANVPIPYIPLTRLPGTYYYFARITHATSPFYCSPAAITTPLQRVNVEGPAPIIGPGVICLGSAITLSDTTPNGAWSSSDSSVARIDSSGSVTSAHLGNTIIRYSDTSGCTASIPLTVAGVAADSIRGTSEVCSGTSTILTNSILGGIWSSADTAVARISSTGIVRGMAVGTARMSYYTGCGVPAYYDVRVTGIHPISSPDTVCMGSLVLLHDSSGSGRWSTDNGSIAYIDTSGYLTALASGRTTVSFTSFEGCTATKLITVYPVPEPITGMMTTCPGTAVRLYEPIAGGVWSTTPLHVATIFNDGTLAPNAEGVATISYTNRCGTVLAYDTIRELAPPPLSYDTLSGILQVWGGYAYYQWYVDSSWGTVPIAGANGPELPGFVTPDYTYQLEASDYRGCTALSEPFTFTEWEASGITPSGMEAAYIKPNPANDVLYLVCNGDVSTIISDMQGKIVGTGSHVKEMNISSLPAGVYIVTLYRGADLLFKQKLTKL